MGTVKYSGPVASFHCPTEATIRSLKVHFSPKQEGSGDPSPENVRPIVGWDGVEVNKSGRNLMHLVGYSAVNLNTTTATRKLTNSNGTTINTIDPEKSVTITQTLWPNDSKGSYQNGYFAIIDDNLKFEERYDISFRVTNITNNPLNAALSDLMIYNSKGTSVGSTKIIDGDRITFKNAIYNQNASTPLRHGFDIRICGMSCTISDFIVTAVDTEDRTYEPYRGETVDYEFGVLGKNKLDKNSYKYLNGSIICFGGGTSSEPDGSLFLKAGTYTFSVNTTATSIFASNANKINIVSATNTNTATFTLPESTAIRIGCFIQNATDEEMLAYNYQLELGSTATTYEPYNPNKTVYGGWVDLISGEVQEEYACLKLDENIPLMLAYNSRQDTSTRFYTSTSNAFSGAKHDLNKDCYVNIAKQGAVFDAETIRWFRQGATEFNVYLPNSFTGIVSEDSDQTLYDKAHEYLSVHNIDYVFTLQTPLTYHLAPTALQTFLGHNNVWSNADYVEVEYDLHETQSILARKQFIIANQPHIVKPAAAPLQNFTTDVPAPLKECKVHFKPIQDLHGYDKPWVGGSGKNLFNINAVEQDPDNTTLSNSSARKFATGTYAKGASYSNYWQAGQIIECTINNNAITVSSTTGYGVGFPIKMKEGTTYFISCTMTGNSSGQINIAPYDAEGNYLGDAVLVNYINKTYTAPANIDIGVIIFRNQTSKDNPISTTFSNIQIEVGTAATSYEPYENICPISGWTELEVTRCGKNFSTAATGIEMVQKWPTNNTSSRELLLTGMQPGQEFTLSASFTKASKPSSNKRLYLNGSQKANTTTNAIFQGPSADGPRDAVIHNWVDTDGTIRITHNNRGLTYNDDFIEYAASLQNIQLELGDTATAFEPYNGTTIPITFPSVINALNSTTITANKTLSAKGEEINESGMSLTNYIKVNEGDTYKLTFTSKEGARTRRIYGYDINKEPVESLASASWVTVDTIGTIQATIPSGVEYIRVCYKTADENIFLEGPESSVIYGGYVDLVKGEIVQEYGTINLESLNWTGSGNRARASNSINLEIPDYRDLPNFIAEKYYASSYSTNLTNFHSAIALGSQGFITSYDGINLPTGKMVYKFSEPIHYSLTPEILKTLRGTNNIWSNSNGNIQVQFWKH